MLLFSNEDFFDQHSAAMIRKKVKIREQNDVFAAQNKKSK